MYLQTLTIQVHLKTQTILISTILITFIQGEDSSFRWIVNEQEVGARGHLAVG